MRCGRSRVERPGRAEENRNQVQRGNLAKVAEPTGALAEIANRSCQADPFASSLRHGSSGQAVVSDCSGKSLNRTFVIFQHLQEICKT